MPTKRKFQEFLDSPHIIREDVAEDGSAGRRIKAIGAVGDIPNRNKRLYPSPVLREAVGRAKSRLDRSLSQGRYAKLLGEVDHPQDKPRFLATVVNWDGVEFNEATRQIELSGRLVETTAGRDAIAMMDAGVMPGVSLRGWGESKKENGLEVVTKLELTGFDLVFEPSFEAAQVTVFESYENEDEEPEMMDDDDDDDDEDEEETEMEKETEKKEEQARREQAEREAKAITEQAEREAKEKKDNAEIEAKRLREAAEKDAAKERETAAEGKKLLEAERQEVENEAKRLVEEARAELQRLQNEREVEAALTEVAAGLTYPATIREKFMESLRKAAPQNAAQVKEFAEARREEYDAIVAEARVRSMGYDVTVLGPVYEVDKAAPRHLTATAFLTEQVRSAGFQTMTDELLAQNKSKGADYARRYLESFDRAYRTQLEEESANFRKFMEAQTTSQLNLPYSVMRAIIREAVPTLVAANVFDFGTIDRSPERVYFESYTAESGAQPAIANEAVTSADDTWVSLANKRLVPGTVNVEDDGGGTPYVEGTDYEVDYGNGRIYFYAAGGIANATALDVDYTYNKVRAGENVGIQRGRGALSYQTIEAMPDRLATQITDEAIVFSQSQLNWDAVGRVLSMVSRELREMIDTGVIRLAVSQARISGNTGGTFDISDDSLDELVAAIGQANVAVQQDYYTPTAILASLSNADRLSNWTGLLRDGFPDAMLDAAGFQRMRIKALPVFASTAMPDDAILVVHPELVQHRVLASRPMRFHGPYKPFDSNGNVLPNDEWYVEEYNATFSHIKEKGGYVKVQA